MNTSYKNKSHLRGRTALLAVLLISSTAIFSQILPTGSSTIGTTVTYKIQDDVVYSDFYWTAVNGNVGSPYRSGTWYYCPVTWTGAGSNTVTFYANGSAAASVVISVSCATVAVPAPTFSAASSTCTPRLVSYTGAPASGITWYWQTSATGIDMSNSTSSYSALASATLYVRAIDSWGCWSNGAASYAVSVDPRPASPAVPSATTNTCGAKTLTRGTPPAGITWYWQGTDPVGTTTSNSATTYSASATGSYYIGARNNTSTCWNTSNTGTTITVNPTPAAPAASNTSLCGTGTMTATPGANGNSIRWYNALTGGALLVTSTTSPSTSVTTTYYITSYNTTTSCESTAARLPVTLTINPALGAPTASNTSLCGTGTMTATPGTNANSIRWYDAATSGALLATGTTSPSTSATTTYYITSYNTTTTCESTAARLPVTLTINGVPAAPTVAGTVRFGPGVFSLTASGTPSGGTYNWFNPSNALVATGANYTTPTVSAITTNYAYVKSVSSANCVSTSTWISLMVEPLPVITSANNRVILGATVTLDAGAGYLTYDWRNSSNVQVGTSQMFTTNIVGVYTLTVTKTGVPGTGTASGNVLGQTDGTNMNFIVSNTLMARNVSTSVQIDFLPIDSLSQSIQYFDGLGRPMQTVMTQGSPLKSDIVSPTVYDNFGREFRKYLPFVKQNTGLFKAGVIDGSGNYAAAALNFYNSASDKIIDDTRYFSETVFEASPLNRPSQDFGPGQNWKDNNKFVAHSYPLNKDGTGAGQEKIICWSINTSGIPVRSTATNTNVSGGYYTTAQLAIKNTTDEQGNDVREYVDKTGHTILKKVEAVAGAALTDASGWTQTYYIYDDFGSLRYVLQPELVKNLVGSGLNPSAADLGNFAFIYKYDKRNRMVTKKVPGADSVLMIYDKRDRVILTQDGNQRNVTANATNYWTFTKYDLLNRPVLTGIKDTATSVMLTRVQMQAVVYAHFAKSSAAWGETFVGAAVNGNIHGYTNKAYPVITGSTAGEKDSNKYLTVTYYDNYTFRSDWPGTYTYLNESLSVAFGTITYRQPAVENTSLLGQPTGAKTKVLDGGSITGGYTWLKSITYYDDKYRVIQTQSDNYKGGVITTSNVYDFTGKVLKSKETTTERDVTWVNQVGVNVIGNKLKRIAASAAGASSQQVLAAGQNGYLELIVSETTSSNRYIGFNDTDPDTGFTNIDYALFLNGTTLKVVENNSAKQTLTGVLVPGDVLKIERTGSTIKYYRNGVALTYSNTSASTGALLVDNSFQSTNATLVGVRTSFSTTSNYVTRRLEYDHAGRLLNTWHSLNGAAEILFTKNEYNEIGQLVDKKLHSTQANGSDAKQSVDYRYNIRGWLTSMNNSQLTTDATNDDTNDYFGMNLLYEQSNTNLGSTGIYNGNISGMKWSTNLGQADIKETGYNFSYDALNRLLNANARMSKTNLWQAGYYNESISQYDLNGNIKNLTRTGDAGNQIDNLTYSYGAFGNQLQYVQDNTSDATNKAKGFVDGNPNTATDYSYDANGNMTRDLNKGIGASITDANNLITYNFLNLPEVVTKAGNTVQYIYTAGGQKISQIVTNVNTSKQTDYVGAYIYENDALQFINHEEGRIVMSGTKLIYTNSFNTVTSDITTINATATAYPLNGENYVKATATSTVTGNGCFPIGGTFAVQPGDRYRIRFKGYKVTHAAYLQVKVGATVLSSPGTALPNSSATESWIEQLVIIPAGATTMQVGVVWPGATTLNEVMYLNELEIDQLTTNTAEYQYHLKDHLGNVRVTFTTQTTTKTFSAGFETANQATEAGNFSYYQTSKINTVTPTNIKAHTGNSAYLLNGGYAGQVGIAKSFSVMPGDQVSIQAYAKYSTPSGTPTNYSSFVSSLLAAFNLSAPVSGETGTPASGVNTFGNWEIGSSGDESKSDAIKAFVTIVLFDRNYNFIDVAYQAVQGDSLKSTYTVKQPGYAYLYISNEHPYLMDVYFDDVKITYTPSAIVQQEDFYPFGLTYNSYQRENSLVNNFKYDGKEQIDDLGIDWYDFAARMYMPEIGRWGVEDPVSESYFTYSPYNYVRNNPVLRIDPNGMWDITVHVAKNRETYGYGVAVVTDRNGKEVFRFLVRAQGSAGSDRMKKNSDTPLGVYDIPDKDMWIPGYKIGENRKAYGPNDILILNGESGEIIDSGRDLIRVHGGRQEVYNEKTGEWSEINPADLKKTHGCLRAQDEDVKTLKEITDDLTSKDKKEVGGKLTVKDDYDAFAAAQEGQDSQKKKETESFWSGLSHALSQGLDNLEKWLKTNGF